ncbi:MAG: alpha/beta hydrolase family esterase [Acidimicrobiia bacterium]
MRAHGPDPAPATPAARRPGRRLATAVATLALLAAACSSSSSGAARPAKTTSTTTTGAPAAGGATGPSAAQAALVAARPYSLHEPPRAADPAPLVVLLHGYGASGAAQEAYFKLAPATDARRMLFVALDGTMNALQKRFWNATDACCAGPATAGVDDSAYISAVIADIEAHHRVDPRRIYLVGHSKGGFMSYRMACDHADVIAAFVSVEAATYDDPGKCAPSGSVAMLEIHGTGDRTIPYGGGAIRGVPYPGAKETVRTWARYDGCRLQPDRPAPAPHAIEVDLPPATVTSYSADCRGNGHAELWTQPDGVHIPRLDPTFATQLIDFLLAHPKR